MAKIKPLNTQEWFKRGNALQIEHFYIELDNLDNVNGRIEVHICHTNAVCQCQDEIAASVLVSLDKAAEFTWNGLVYRLVLLSVDHAGNDYNTLAAVVKLVKVGARDNAS